MAAFRGSLRSFHQRLAGEALSNLAGVVGHCIPARQRTRLRQSGGRQRVFTPMATFWNFLAQVRSPAQPCRETVRQIQAARRDRPNRSEPRAVKRRRKTTIYSPNHATKWAICRTATGSTEISPNECLN